MIQSMFSVPIYHNKIDSWEKIKDNILSVYSNIESDMQLLDNNPVNTNYHIDNKKIIENISNILKNEIEKFLINIGFGGCTIKTGWFEQSFFGNYHHPHNHGSTGYSAICFVKYDIEDHTPTYFISPFNNFVTGDDLNYFPNEIEEGSIIVFPSSILHYTIPNKSNKERLVLSFNMDVF